MRMFNTKSLLVKGLSYFLSFVAAATPFHAIAAEVKIQQAAAQGQSFAEMLRRDMQSPTGSGGTIHFPDMGESIEVKDLYPGTSGQSDHDASYFAPAGDDVGTAEEFHDDGSQLDRKGVDKQIVLYEDATSGGPVELGYTKALDSSPSIQGAAYKIILDKKDAAKPDLRNDPLVNSSREIFEDLDDFADCKLEEVIAKRQGSIHVGDMAMCERVTKFTGACTIDHQIDLKTREFDVYVAAKGEVWLTVEFDLTQGWWKTVSPTDGLAFNAIIPHIDYDAVCSSDSKASQTDHLGTWDWVSNGLSGKFDSTVYYRVLQKPTCDNGLVGRVQIQDTSGGHDGGKYVMGGRFKFHMVSLVGDSWGGTDECVAAAKSYGDGFCEIETEITKGPKNDQECVNVNGYTICPGTPLGNAISSPPVPGIPNLSLQLSVNTLSCDFNVGDMECYEDAYGDIQCPTNEGDVLNSCTEYENNPACGFIKSTCIDGAQGQSGTCYAYEEVWDCGSTVNFEYDDSDEQFVCEGPISCMGEECVSINRETSDSFGKAAALLNVVEHADGMMDCSENSNEGTIIGGSVQEGEDTAVCTIFKGEEGTCKKAMGGSVDCCEKPKGISLGDYLRMLQAMKKIDSALVAVKQAGSAPGATGLITKFRYPDQGVYNTITKPVAEGFQKITQPFVNYAESATGIVTKAQQMLVEKTLEVVEKVLGEAAKEFMGAMLQELGYQGLVEGAGSAAAGSAAENMGNQAGNAMAQSMGTAVGSIISVVGWVYMVYQVAMLIIQMIYKCTKDEMQLMVEVQLKKCSYLGSYCDQKVLGMCTVKKQAYCCYDSPLARIVVEQGVKQLGRDQGPAKAPQCDGLTLEELERLDWDKIDLSEWTGMLIQHNLYAGTNVLTPDSITGSGSFLPGEMGGTRPDVQNRTEQRFEDGKIDDIRTDLSQKMDFSAGKR